jgi:hypothetical protein
MCKLRTPVKTSKINITNFQIIDSISKFLNGIIRLFIQTYQFKFGVKIIKKFKIC